MHKHGSVNRRDALLFILMLMSTCSVPLQFIAYAVVYIILVLSASFQLKGGPPIVILRGGVRLECMADTITQLPYIRFQVISRFVWVVDKQKLYALALRTTVSNFNSIISRRGIGASSYTIMVDCSDS